ncbi:MAG: T9SS type A sorting domain-containing protein [Bacteroidia bacterium]
MSLLVVFPSYGQHTKVKDRAMHYILSRPAQPDFNIARAYYQAYEQLQSEDDIKSKKSNTWTPIGPMGNDTLWGIGRLNDLQIHPTDTNIWFACYGKGGVWKSINAGENWTPLYNGLPFLNSTQLAINPNNPNEMYVLTGDVALFEWNYYAGDKNHHYAQGVYKTTDGGQNWVPTGMSFQDQSFKGDILSDIRIHPSNSSQLVVVGKNGIYTSSDAGDSWSKKFSGQFRSLEINPMEPNTLLATGYYSHFHKEGKMQVLKSYDFGETWTQVHANLPETNLVVRVELAYAPSDTNLVYMIATDTTHGYYATYRSTNAGDSFKMVNSLMQDSLNILGWNFKLDTGGQGYYDLTICVDRYNSQKFWVGGINVWESADGGENFLPVSRWASKYNNVNALHADIHLIKQHPTNKSVFVCHDGGLSRTFNISSVSIASANANQMQTKWTDYTKGLNVTEFYRLSVNSLDTSHVMAGAQDNSSVFRDQSGFINISGGDGMESLFLDEYSRRVSSSQNGNFRIFDASSGKYVILWYHNPPSGEIGAWVTPVSAIGGDIVFGYSNVYSAYTGTAALEKMSNFQAEAGQKTPKLTRSMVTDPFVHSIYLGKYPYTNEQKTAYLDSSKSELWVSFSPNVWTDITAGLPEPFFPAALEINHSNNQEAWVVCAGYFSGNKVFHTLNGGQSWENISYNLPNVNINGIRLQQDQTANLYLCTDIGVFYLSRWEDKWKYYSIGLPKVEINELEIQYEAKMLRAATFGRGLWEVPLVDQLATKVAEQDLIHSKLSPNPTNDVVLFECSQNVRQSDFKIIDITGREMDLKSNQLSSFSHSIDVSAYPAGQYFLIVYVNGNRLVEKFQKY